MESNLTNEQAKILLDALHLAYREDDGLFDNLRGAFGININTVSGCDHGYDDEKLISKVLHHRPHSSGGDCGTWIIAWVHKTIELTEFDDPRNNKCENCKDWPNTCAGCGKEFMSNLSTYTKDKVACCCTPNICTHYGDTDPHHRYGESSYCDNCCPVHGPDGMPGAYDELA